MKRKIGDFTLAEIKGICEKHIMCRHCPFERKKPRAGYLGADPCILAEVMEYPYEIDVDKEVEIKEEEK